MSKQKSLNDLIKENEPKNPMKKIGITILTLVALGGIGGGGYYGYTMYETKQQEVAAKDALIKAERELTNENMSKVVIVGQPVAPYIEKTNEAGWKTTKRFVLSDPNATTEDGIPDENIIDIYKLTDNTYAYVHYHNASFIEYTVYQTIEEALTVVRKTMYAQVEKENEQILEDVARKNIDKKSAPDTKLLVNTFTAGMTSAEFKTAREKYTNIASCADFKFGRANIAHTVVASDGYVLIMTDPNGITGTKAVKTVKDALDYVKSNYIIE